MHGRFPIFNKYYLTNELFPLLSKEEKRHVYFPTKEERSKKVSKRDLKMSREDEELYEKKYKAKK
jgi:hypothetical protein